MKIIHSIIILLLIGFLSSCYKAKTSPVNPSACDSIISYSDDIVPIINQSCKTNLGPGTGCHDSWIGNYANVKWRITTGEWQHDVWEIYSMPKIPNNFGIDSLTTDEIQLMKCWVDQGYPEN